MEDRVPPPSSIFDLPFSVPMALQLRFGDQVLDLARDGDGTLTLGGAPADARLTRVGPHAWHLLLDGRSAVVTVEPLADGRVRATLGGHRVEVAVKDETALLLEQFGMAEADTSAAREVRAPMPGLVVAVLVAPGDAVEAGQGLVVLEAMKMENELKAPAAGTVAAVHAAPGAAVGKNDLLVELEG